jgi:hypothetical protein
MNALMEQQMNGFGPNHVERRSDRRYDLSLELRWKLIRRRRVLATGTGTTVDLSSGGILFQTDRPVPNGGNLEISISWPARLHNVAPMQLVVSGRVVRGGGGKTAIRMIQHEFRTSRQSADNGAATGRKIPLTASAEY